MDKFYTGGKQVRMEQLKFSTIEGELRQAGYLDIYKKAVDNSFLQDYFFEPQGIHGLGHMKRVLLFNLILAYLEKLTSQDTDILVNCALYHDIGRINNYADAQHGKLSYEKAVLKNLLEDAAKDQDSQITKFIIICHCIDDNLIPAEVNNYAGIKDQARALKLLNIFKDSDGLDRIRFGGLDVSYLRTEHAPELVTLAEELFNRTIVV